jgi:hypothetical protein
MVIEPLERFCQDIDFVTAQLTVVAEDPCARDHPGEPEGILGIRTDHESHEHGIAARKGWLMK